MARASSLDQSRCSMSTEQDHAMWRLLDEAAQRQRTRFEALHRADAQPRTPPKLSAKELDLMRRFAWLVEKTELIDSRLTAKEAAMAKRELQFVRADAEDPANPDKVMTALDAIRKRLDKLERRGRPDDDDDEDEVDRYMRETANAAGMPGKGAGDMTGDDEEEDSKPKLPLPVPGSEGKAPPMAADSFLQRRNRCLDVQAKIDPVYLALGMQAPAPLAHEARRDYLLRLLQPIKRFDSAWSKVELAHLSGDALKVATDSIMGAAMVEAKNPTQVPPGRLREVVKHLDTGHVERRFYASPGTGAVRAWLTPNSGRRYVTAINLKPQSGYSPAA